MSLVKVKTNGQVILPSSLRQRAGVNVGDVLEAKIEKGKVDESIEQIRKGEFYGPFDTAEEMLQSLHRNSKRGKKTNRRSSSK